MKKNALSPIFLVEDNEVYAKSLQGFLQNCFPDIAEIKIFSIGELCLMELHRNPGIVIMDYFLNSQFEEAHNGLEIIKRIKAQKPETNIIVLSSLEKFSVALEAIEKYDCSYLQKGKDVFSKIQQLIQKIINENNTIKTNQYLKTQKL